MNSITHNTTSARLRALGASALALGLAGFLSGCATGVAGVDGATTVLPAATSVQGKVFGGQQPVSNSSIQLWAVGSSAKGASTRLITGTNVYSDANGNFAITGTYTCPANAYVYLVATGGNPGLSGNVNNTGLALMAALGSCSVLKATLPTIIVNEVTTVASVQALAPFMQDFQHIGAPSTNFTGLQNAFANVNSLVNLATGTSPGLGLPATSTAPAAELNTLGNILSYCINSNGTDGSCANLFSSAHLPGSAMPSDTIGAMLNIVQNPANNVGPLFNYSTTNPPFQPKLSSAPADWTVAITSTGNGIAAPTGIAIDANGAAWIANSGGTSITSLTAQLAPRSGTTGYTNGNLLGPQGVAIDSTGNAWIANSYGSSVVELDPSGNLLSPTGGYTLGGITSPFAIALDSSNNVWVTNYDNNTVSGLSTTGGTVASISGSPFSASGAIAMPTGVAIDASSNVWISNSFANTVTKLSSSGATLGAAYTDGILQAPYGLALDSNSNAFVAGNGFNEISVLNSAGANVANGPISGSAIAAPAGVAIDGANAIFVTNNLTAGSLAMLTSSTATPIKLGTLNAPVGVAVDASGSVWTTNSGDNTVSQFIGLATVVRTPLASRYTPF